jgi:hypothetical protein
MGSKEPRSSASGSTDGGGVPPDDGVAIVIMVVSGNNVSETATVPVADRSTMSCEKLVALLVSMLAAGHNDDNEAEVSKRESALLVDIFSSLRSGNVQKENKLMLSPRLK